MTEPDYEALGRYAAHMDTFDAITTARRTSLKALQRWSANTDTGKRCVMQLSLDALEATVRELRQQQDQLDQLARVINTLAHDLDKPGVRFVAHQLL